MTVYALAQFSIRDPVLYGRYLARFPEVLMRHGGRVVIAELAPRVVEGSWDGDKIRGLLSNDPHNIPSLHAGQSVTVSVSRVFDYIRRRADGTVEGNETAKLIEQKSC